MFFPESFIVLLDSSGGYIVFNTNNKHVQNGASGEVTSVPMFTNGSACMEFWYNMPNSLAILEVYLLGGAGYRNLLWRRTGATSGWVKATVQIHFTGTFQVYIEIRIRCSAFALNAKTS